MHFLHLRDLFLLFHFLFIAVSSEDALEKKILNKFSIKGIKCPTYHTLIGVKERVSSSAHSHVKLKSTQMKPKTKEIVHSLYYLSSVNFLHLRDLSLLFHFLFIAVTSEDTLENKTKIDIFLN